MGQSHRTLSVPRSFSGGTRLRSPCHASTHRCWWSDEQGSQEVPVFWGISYVSSRNAASWGEKGEEGIAPDAIIHLQLYSYSQDVSALEGTAISNVFPNLTVHTNRPRLYITGLTLRQFSSVSPGANIPHRLVAEAAGTSFVQPRNPNRSDRLFPPTMSRCEIP